MSMFPLGQYCSIDNVSSAVEIHSCLHESNIQALVYSHDVIGSEIHKRYTMLTTRLSMIVCNLMSCEIYDLNTISFPLFYFHSNYLALAVL